MQTYEALKKRVTEKITLPEVDKNKLMRIVRGLWSGYRLITLFSISMILLFPIIYIVSMSLRPAGQVSDPMVIWIPRSFTLKNIVDTIGVMNYLPAVLNTLRISLLSSVLTIFSCSIAGYGFARFKFRLRQPLFMLVLLMLIVPPQNILISAFLYYKNFDFFGLGSLVGLFTGKALTINLIGNEFSMYLPALFGNGIRAGLYILIFNKFFSNLPRELEDAAYIDGCGVYKTYFKVMLPNSLSALLTVFLFSMVWYWNDYFHTSVFMQNATTLSIQLTRLKFLLNEALNPLGKGVFVDVSEITVRLQAGCLLTILPLIVFYIFVQRNFTEGIERTGIVG